MRARSNGALGGAGCVFNCADDVQACAARGRVCWRLGANGGWIGFDGIRSGSVPLHLELVQNMASQGLLNQTLVSMDAGWYHVGEPGGGNYRGYDSLFLEFLPSLKKTFSEAQVRQLLVTNPMHALSLQVKPGK